MSRILILFDVCEEEGEGFVISLQDVTCRENAKCFEEIGSAPNSSGKITVMGFICVLVEIRNQLRT